MNKKTKLVLLILLIAASAYYLADAFLWGVNKDKKRTWTDAEKKLMYDTCFLTSEMARKYPENGKANCSCIVDSIVRKYSPEEVEKISKLPFEERSKLFHDILVHCGKKAGVDTLK